MSIRAYIVNNKGNLQLVDSLYKMSPTSNETIYRKSTHEVKVSSLEDIDSHVLEQYETEQFTTKQLQYIATVEGSYAYCLQVLDNASKNRLPLSIPQIVC